MMNQENIQRAREELRRGYPDLPIPQTSYLVLSTARSGSTLMCRHLTEIGYGRPIEAFNSNVNPRKRLNWGIDYNDPYAFMKKVIEYQTVNGVFGMKLSPNQFNLFLSATCWRKALTSPATGCHHPSRAPIPSDWMWKPALSLRSRPPG